MSILTVRQLTALIKDTVENGFPYVWVRGEVTNVSRPASGHVYFSLKDGDALLQAMWFRTDQKEREAFDPLTGEVFEDGPRIIVGRHPEKRPTNRLRRAAHGLCPTRRLPACGGTGAGQRRRPASPRAGALKQKLAAKGYFSLERKREMPGHPLPRRGDDRPARGRRARLPAPFGGTRDGL
ncbi:MAG: exodeoxyribonuclease VII large subunit [Bilophila sp.]